MMKHPDARSHLAGAFKARLVFARGNTEVFPSSGFLCCNGSILGDLPLVPNTAHVHVCQQFCCFSLSNFSRPEGFNGEFA